MDMNWPAIKHDIFSRQLRENRQRIGQMNVNRVYVIIHGSVNCFLQTHIMENP